MMKLIFFLFSFLMVFSCQNNSLKNISAEKKDSLPANGPMVKKEKVLIEYFAPTRKIVIDSNIIWLTEIKEEYDNPVSAVPSGQTQTLRKAVLADSSIQEIKKIITSNGFMNLKDSYGAADGERNYLYTINVTMGSSAKNVVFKSNPSAESAPKEFSEVEKALNNLVKGISNWENVEVIR
ncbi:MAG: hypothetical protein K2X86_11920 [Cytophagaceae bacterium]|nr:hypothetical protein [Cytophagaceae bacterium]